MGQKWTKAQHEKFSATMKRKRKHEITLPTAAWPNGTLPLFKKWNQEADEAFRVLTLEQKAVLLAQVKPSKDANDEAD